MARINISQILMKRGNTTAAGNYIGPLGELVVDTGLKTVRIQDGVTAGGMSTLATNVQIQTLSTAIANISANTSGLYSNANVASYLTASNIITGINANVTAANLQITNLWSNAGVQSANIATLVANAGVQADAIAGANAAIVTANTALKGYVDTQLSTLTNGASTALDTLLEIGTALGNNANFSATMITWLGNVTANTTAANTAWQANAGVQADAITSLISNAAVQSANIATLFANAGVQADAITSLQANITAANLAIAAASGTYSNTNVAAYLSASTTSNVGAGNLTVVNNFSTNVISANSFTYANGTSILAGIGGTYTDSNVASYLPTYTGNIAGNIVKSGYTWTFSNTGTTTFPTGVRLSNARGANTVNFTTDIDKSFQIETQTSTTGRLWSFGTDGNLTLPQNANINFSNGVSILAGITGTYSNANVASYLPTYSGAISANIAKNGYTWRFGTNGTTQFPSSQILAPAGESITMQSDQYSQLMWENANVTVAPNMAINSNFYVAQNNATLDIGYRDGSSTQLIKSWYWNVDGGMTLPEGGTITEGGGISGAIRLTPAGGANSNQALMIYPTGAAEGDHIHLTAGGGSTELYLGNDYHYVKLVNGGNVELRTDDLLGNVGTWNFGTDANLTLPQTGYLRVGTGIVAGSLVASPAPIISGFSSISAENFKFQGNGVNILSTVTGTYSNTNVAAYLTGNTISTINTTGNIKTIANVISPNYLFANGVNILSTITAVANLSTLTSNIGWTAVGATPPTFTTTSNGTKIVLWPSISSTMVDYAIGIEAGNTWFSIPQAANNFGYKWYAGNTAITTLSGNGTLTTGNITTTGNVSVGGNLSVSGTFSGSGSGLTGVALKTTGSWTVTTGTGTYSFTVPASGTYQLWVDCNIPNGILVWNATATITNSNVPVVGAQYAWVYNGGGSPIDFTSIPNQFVGTGNTIVRSSTAPSATTNRFDFGLNNTSGGNVTVRYGWVAIS